MTRTARAWTGAALAALAISTSLALPTMANAAPVTCYGDYCSGADPTESGCAADAYTTVFEETEVGRLDVRWSPTCKTNWVRWVKYDRGIMLSMIPLEMAAVQDTGYTQSFSFGVNGDSDRDHPDYNTWVTPMIYSPVHKVQGQMTFQCTGVGDCLIYGALEGPMKTAWS